MMKIAQVGLHGFGRIHLERIDRLAGLGRVELVAGADPAGLPPGREIPCYDSLSELLAHHAVDIVSIATPIATHLSLADEALRAGAHVMLEKPPVTSLVEFDHLRQAVGAAGRALQIGFQSFGGGGIARMQQLAADELGQILSVRAWGMWQRDRAYFQRARWAGHRILDGRRVADGVCTNALAHAIATACRIVGITTLADLTSIETELYRCFDTQSDDTSWLRIKRHTGVPVDICLTLCGPYQENPTVTLVGERGQAELQYTEDIVTWRVGEEVRQEKLPRMDLLENLVDHIESGTDLLVPLEATSGFMAALEATQSAPDPMPIPAAFIDWEGQGDQAHPVPQAIATWQQTCLRQGRGFHAAGAPWASPDAAYVWYPPAA